MVVGVDGSAGADAALRWAAAEARLRKIPLRVVHAWIFSYPGVGGYGYLGATPDDFQSGLGDLHRAAEDLLARATEGLEAEDVEIERTVVDRAPAEALVGAAAAGDLLVVGSRGHGGFSGLLLGSVSQQGAQHALCPVVIVHDPESSASESADKTQGSGR